MGVSGLHWASIFAPVVGEGMMLRGKGECQPECGSTLPFQKDLFETKRLGSKLLVSRNTGT